MWLIRLRVPQLQFDGVDDAEHILAVVRDTRDFSPGNDSLGNSMFTMYMICVLKCVCELLMCVHAHLCVCVSEFACVCQTGSLTGGISAVGTERVHCPSGEKDLTDVYCFKNYVAERNALTRWVTRTVHTHTRHACDTSYTKNPPQKHTWTQQPDGRAWIHLFWSANHFPLHHNVT